MHCDWLILLLLLLTLTIWFSLDHKRNVSDGVMNRVRRNGNCDLHHHHDFIKVSIRIRYLAEGKNPLLIGDTDSKSVALMTLLRTLIFYFHLIINTLMTLLTTLTPLLVKTSLMNT